MSEEWLYVTISKIRAYLAECSGGDDSRCSVLMAHDSRLHLR